MQSRPVKILLVILLAGLAGGIFAAESKAQPRKISVTARTIAKPGSYQSGGVYYAVGESVHVVAKRELAELQALKDAAGRMADLLAKGGWGSKKDIARGVEDSALKETELSSWKLGKVQIENVYQERWEAPGGKEAWSVRMMISIRRK